ncbi:type II toxin-antitoxin system RelE/ParE family toxin [Brevundimonas subvibrioides]|uniref:type II toxin-antitoxin system RelE/ParE family toxin n=1 Tax=Brevundimonas subvibrioides TaxID=74313 RepID=UPI0022B52508|nr:type II toxin-antitoxin system RelE/ParE family toxin [Brevundimonas subvibrioides]
MSPIDDSSGFELEFSETFDAWLQGLRDHRAAARITVRLERLERGHWGDARSVGEGVTELRIDYGPGYRLYAARRGRRIVLMLAGGDKSSQRRDIEAAKVLAREYGDGT